MACTKYEKKDNQLFNEEIFISLKTSGEKLTIVKRTINFMASIGFYS